MTITLGRVIEQTLFKNTFVEVKVHTNISTQQVHFSVMYIDKVHVRPTTKGFQTIEKAMSWAKEINNLTKRNWYTKKHYCLNAFG